MADRFPGGVISKTPPTVVGPVDGEGGSASGVWTLAEQLGLQKAGSWPQGILPRELYAWGGNNSGQLGDGTTVIKSSPVQIGSLTNWEQIAGKNSGSTASVKTDGTLWIWGRNTYGQLGHNNIINLSSPVQVGSLTNWSYVAITSSHTACVKTDGTLWAWGSNDRGALGLNLSPSIKRSSPVQVGSLTNWARVSVGNAGSVAITTAGELYSWGDNTFGQLGHNNIIDLSSPVQVGALTNWQQVDMSISFGCLAVKTDGTLWGWGDNNYGQLGDSAPRRSSPVQIGALTHWKSVAGPFGNNGMAITNLGALFTWGRNNNGYLGTGDTIARSSPVQVGALTDWAKLGDTRCLAIKTDGTLWGWGRNAAGNIGDGTAINKSSPVQVGASTNWFRVASSTVAITRG